MLLCEDTDVKPDSHIPDLSITVHWIFLWSCPCCQSFPRHSATIPNQKHIALILSFTYLLFSLLRLHRLLVMGKLAEWLVWMLLDWFRKLLLSYCFPTVSLYPIWKKRSRAWIYFHFLYCYLQRDSCEREFCFLLVSLAWSDFTLILNSSMSTTIFTVYNLLQHNVYTTLFN